MRTSKYDESNASALKDLNTLSQKSCQGGSSKLNIPYHRKPHTGNRWYNCDDFNLIILKMLSDGKMSTMLLQIIQICGLLGIEKYMKNVREWAIGHSTRQLDEKNKGTEVTGLT
ncbi:hypothetical protein Tco_0846538 [Tanacetum coccineum]